MSLNNDFSHLVWLLALALLANSGGAMGFYPCASGFEAKSEWLGKETQRLGLFLRSYAGGVAPENGSKEQKHAASFIPTSQEGFHGMQRFSQPIY